MNLVAKPVMVNMKVPLIMARFRDMADSLKILL